MSEGTLKGIVFGAGLYGLGVGLLLAHPIAGCLAGLGIILTALLDRIELKP